VVRGREVVVDVNRPEATGGGGRLAASLTVDGARHDVEVVDAEGGALDLVVDGRRVVAWTSGAADGATWVTLGGRTRVVRPAAQRTLGTVGAGAAAAVKVTPSFPATVVRVHVAPGDAVARGQALVVVSAMKMDLTLEAPYDGVVLEVRVAVGQAVAPGDELIVVERAAEPVAASEAGDERRR
jgi:biotin carboxyl carrier protein